MASSRSSEYIKEAVEIFESSSKEEQKQLLRLLKLQKARILAGKIDKVKGGRRISESYFDDFVHKVRSGKIGK